MSKYHLDWYFNVVSSAIYQYGGCGGPKKDRLVNASAGAHLVVVLVLKYLAMCLLWCLMVVSTIFDNTAFPSALRCRPSLANRCSVILPLT